jgi:hypothetical protein
MALCQITIFLEGTDTVAPVFPDPEGEVCGEVAGDMTGMSGGA